MNRRELIKGLVAGSILTVNGVRLGKAAPIDPKLVKRATIGWPIWPNYNEVETPYHSAKKDGHKTDFKIKPGLIIIDHNTFAPVGKDGEYLIQCCNRWEWRMGDRLPYNESKKDAFLYFERSVLSAIENYIVEPWMLEHKIEWGGPLVYEKKKFINQLNHKLK